MDNQDSKKHFRFTRGGTRAFHIIILFILGVAGILAVILISLRGHLDVESFETALSFKNRTGRPSLDLISPQTHYKVGDIFDVTVLVTSRDVNITGTDIQLSYEPTQLRLEPVDGKVGNLVEKYLDTKNSVFENFPGFNVNDQKGLITFSALTPPGSHFSGSGEVARLRFKALKKGPAQLQFISRRGSQTDTNVNSMNRKDVVGVTGNLEIVIAE